MLVEQKKTRFGPAELFAIVLFATLVIIPWLLVGAWSRVPSWLMFVAAGLLVLDSLHGAPRSYLPTAIWPLMLGIALSLSQLLPFGAAPAPQFPPGATHLRTVTADTLVSSEKEAAADIPPSRSANMVPVTSHSFHPPAMRERLALLILATCVFWIAARCFHFGRQLYWLLLTGTICGVVLALFGLMQEFTGGGQLRRSVAVLHAEHSLGPFVNWNNAGGFLNLCLAAGIGLCARHNGRGRVCSTAAGMLIAGGIVATDSHVSIFSLGFAAAVTYAVLVSQKGRRSQWIGLIVTACATLVLVAWRGQVSEVLGRFDPMPTVDTVPGAHLLTWADAMHALSGFSRIGGGLNAHRFVRPPFAEPWRYHADNQFLQALIDGGVACLVLLLTMIGLVVFAIVRLYRRGGPSDTAIAIMGTFALSSQVVSAAFDVGLYLPANALLLAAICGAVVGRAALLKEGRANLLLGTVVERDTLVIVCMPLLIAAIAGGIELHRAAEVGAVTTSADREENAEQWPADGLAAHVNGYGKETDRENWRYWIDRSGGFGATPVADRRRP